MKRFADRLKAAPDEAARNNLWAERFVHDLYEQWEGGNAPGCGEDFNGQPAPVQVAAFAAWVHEHAPGVLAEVFRNAYRGEVRPEGK